MSVLVKRLSIVVSGRVQGVGFRYFTREIAEQYGITGWVRNCYNGDVEVEAQGQDNKLEQFLQELKEGPPMGIVRDMHQKEIRIKNEERFFSIQH